MANHRPPGTSVLIIRLWDGSHWRHLMAVCNLYLVLDSTVGLWVGNPSAGDLLYCMSWCRYNVSYAITAIEKSLRSLIYNYIIRKIIPQLCVAIIDYPNHNLSEVVSQFPTLQVSWWRHQMETFSALLAICTGNPPVSGEFPAQRPVTRSFDVFFDLRTNKRLSKHWWGWWFETPSWSLWRQCNG